MSVKPTADELIESFREHVKLAVKDLVEFCYNEPCGFENYNDSAEIKYSSILKELVELKKRM